MVAHKQTGRDQGGGERHGQDEIGCGELRREPHDRAREGRRLPDMGEDGVEQNSGGGGVEPVGRNQDERGNDGKTSAAYARRLRESGRGEGTEVMLVGFRMRNEFRELLLRG